VNLWVEKAKYEDQLNDNYLNTTTHTNSFGRVSDRDAMLQEMGDLMVQDIVPSTVSAFGAISQVSAANSDGLNVLIYDIQDNFQFSGEFVGGYFDPADKFDAVGNRMNAIHMDLYPSNPGGAPIPLSGFGQALPRKDFFHVLAHELQHLIHSQFDNVETIWANEGFSQFAIYRVFHGKRFQNGDLILESPSDAPSQVEFWLQNPSFSLLMSGDEPGIQGGSIQRSDSAELRGLGYLFFTYLWEALGGRVGIGGTLEPGGADQAFRSMIASGSRGIATLEPTLNLNAKNFKDLYSRFAFGLIEEISSIAPFEFFDYHTSGSRQAHLNLGSSSRLVDGSFLPTSFSLSGYEFSFQQFRGPTSSSSTLELSSSKEFDIYTFSNESGNWRLTGFEQTSSLNLWIPRSQTILAVLVNPELETTTIQARFLNSLSNGGTAAAEDLNDTELSLGGTLPSITLGAQSITSQRFINSTNFIVDILNDRPSEANIRKCLANQACVQASHQSISSDPLSRRIRRTSVKIGATDYFYSDLQLQPGQSYDLYYANTSSSSLVLSAVATLALDLFTVTSGAPTPAPTLVVTSPTNDPTPTFTWTSNEQGSTGTFRYQLNDASLVGGFILTTAFSFTSGVSMGEGTHTLYVQELAETGIWSLIGTATVVVDLTPPLAPVFLPSLATASTFSLVWASGGGGGGGIFRYKIDNGNLESSSISTASTLFSTSTTFSLERHSFYLQERDEAGNWSKSATSEFNTVVQASSGGGGGGGGGGGCFIASAAYSGANSKEVRILSKFRDRYLLTNRLGRTLVQTYYCYSPPLAELMNDSLILGCIGQIILYPAVFFAFMLERPVLCIIALIFFFVFVPRTRDLEHC